jgi:hypothetical protein
MNLEKLRGYYSAAAITLANTVVLLIIINVILFVIFAVHDRIRPKGHGAVNMVVARYGPVLNQAYPGMSPEEILELLNESWPLPLEFEPFTQFQELPHTGKYVNVSEAGYRLTKNQGAWPPDKTKFNVFLFGGSTTFNYGLPDDSTIASHLQELLPAAIHKDLRVYNFGHAFYYSTQERILFEKLISRGYVPDMAIFIDGTNEFARYKDEPNLTNRLRDCVSGKMATRLPDFLTNLPMWRAAVSLRIALNSRMSKRKAPSAIVPPSLEEREAAVHTTIVRYTQNKKMVEAVAAAYGVRALFVWQPVPTYKYDVKYHLFYSTPEQKDPLADYGAPRTVRDLALGYAAMDGIVKGTGMGRDFAWCADIQEKFKEPLYVDLLHYTSKFSGEVAKCITESAGAQKN